MDHTTTIQVISCTFGLTLVEYNNFEATEGKRKLDTHFAHISHKIVRWVRVGNNLETGSQLGDLIGVCDCTITLICKMYLIIITGYVVRLEFNENYLN